MHRHGHGKLLIGAYLISQLSAPCEVRSGLPSLVARAIVCCLCFKGPVKLFEQHCVRQCRSVQVVTEPGQADFILAHGTEVRIPITLKSLC